MEKKGGGDAEFIKVITVPLLPLWRRRKFIKVLPLPSNFFYLHIKRGKVQ